MSRRVARALLVSAAVWPLVALALQHRWDVDPWKLMGFGMYATSARRPADLSVELYARRATVWSPVVLAGDLERFKRDRQALGELESVDPLLRRVLEETGAETARVVLRAPRLDAATARTRIQTWTYERER